MGAFGGLAQVLAAGMRGKREGELRQRELDDRFTGAAERTADRTRDEQDRQRAIARQAGQDSRQAGQDRLASEDRSRDEEERVRLRGRETAQDALAAEKRARDLVDRQEGIDTRARVNPLEEALLQARIAGEKADTSRTLRPPVPRQPPAGVSWQKFTEGGLQWERNPRDGDVRPLMLPDGSQAKDRPPAGVRPNRFDTLLRPGAPGGVGAVPPVRRGGSINFPDDGEVDISASQPNGRVLPGPATRAGPPPNAAELKAKARATRWEQLVAGGMSSDAAKAQVLQELPD